MTTKKRYALIALFLLATALADVAAAGATRKTFFESSKVGDILFFALPFSQISVAGIWLALGRAPSPLRILGAGGVLIGWISLAHYQESFLLPSEYAILFLAILASVTALALVARLRGFRFTEISASASKDIANPGPWQFTIARMLAWTTVLAILLGVLKWIGVFSEYPQWSPVESLVALVLLGPGRAVVALAALWAAFGTRLIIARILVLALAEAASISFPYLTGSPGPLDLRLLAVLALEAAFLLGSLLFFRLLGYRLERTRRRDCQPPADTP